MDLNEYVGWLKGSDFANSKTLEFAILDVTQEGKDVVVKLTGQCGFRQISLWGNNQNTLIKKFGKNTDAWLGKKIAISSVIDANTGKTLRIIEQ